MYSFCEFVLGKIERYTCVKDQLCEVDQGRGKLQNVFLKFSYEYFTGKKPVVDMGAMQAMCSELTVSPYLTGEMNVSVMCPSTRMLCKWDENDMAVAVPFELFETVTKGVVATHPCY